MRHRRPVRRVQVGREATTSGTPRISFDYLHYDFGGITDTQKYTTTFPFRNTGTGTLVISQVKPGCGCTVPTLSKYRFEPGEGDTIEVVFDPKGMKDTSTKNIKVVSNSEPESVVTLTFSSTIAPLLRLQSRFLQLGQIPVHKEHRAVVNFSYNDPELEFKSVQVNSPYITARLLESGQTTRLFDSPDKYFAQVEIVISADAPWGTLYSTQLLMDVNGRVLSTAPPIDQPYQMYIQGSLFGELRASNQSRGRQRTFTSTVGIGNLDANTNFEETVQLERTSGQPFRVTGATVAESTLPGVEVRWEQTKPSSYEIVIFGNTGTFRGLVRGTVAVNTDVPGEEQVQILFTGRVK